MESPVMGQHWGSSQTLHSCWSPQARSGHAAESISCQLPGFGPHQQVSACINIPNSTVVLLQHPVKRLGEQAMEGKTLVQQFCYMSSSLPMSDALPSLHCALF